MESEAVKIRGAGIECWSSTGAELLTEERDAGKDEPGLAQLRLWQ
jgi:hypothetical protein